MCLCGAGQVQWAELHHGEAPGLPLPLPLLALQTAPSSTLSRCLCALLTVSALTLHALPHHKYGCALQAQVEFMNSTGRRTL